MLALETPCSGVDGGKIRPYEPRSGEIPLLSLRAKPGSAERAIPVMIRVECQVASVSRRGVDMPAPA